MRPAVDQANNVVDLGDPGGGPLFVAADTNGVLREKDTPLLVGPVALCFKPPLRVCDLLLTVAAHRFEHRARCVSMPVTWKEELGNCTFR